MAARIMRALLFVVIAFVIVMAAPSCSWLRAAFTSNGDGLVSCNEDCQHDDQGEYDCTCKE